MRTRQPLVDDLVRAAARPGCPGPTARPMRTCRPRPAHRWSVGWRIRCRASRIVPRAHAPCAPGRSFVDARLPAEGRAFASERAPHTHVAVQLLRARVSRISGRSRRSEDGRVWSSRPVIIRTAPTSLQRRSPAATATAHQGAGPRSRGTRPQPRLGRGPQRRPAVGSGPWGLPATCSAASGTWEPPHGHLTAPSRHNDGARACHTVRRTWLPSPAPVRSRPRERMHREPERRPQTAAPQLTSVAGIAGALLSHPWGSAPSGASAPPPYFSVSRWVRDFPCGIWSVRAQAHAS